MGATLVWGAARPKTGDGRRPVFHKQGVEAGAGRVNGTFETL
jgi:hypothetical protein